MTTIGGFLTAPLTDKSYLVHPFPRWFRTVFQPFNFNSISVGCPRKEYVSFQRATLLSEFRQHPKFVWPGCLKMNPNEHSFTPYSSIFKYAHNFADFNIFFHTIFSCIVY